MGRNKILRILFIAFLSTYSVACFSINEKEQELLGMSLAKKPSTYTKLFGFEFGNTVTSSLQRAKELGLTILSSKIIDTDNNIRELLLIGKIDELSIAKGKWRLVYKDNSLVSLDVSFPPTYKNFLLIRSQLLSSLGTRFSVGERQESMDSRIKQRLTFGDSEEKKKAITQDLIASIQSGKTFFNYKIEDKFNEINIYYSYKKSISNTEMEPSLNLRYTLISFEADLSMQGKRSIPSIVPK